MAQNAKGALFKNERKKTEKHPDYTGNFVMTKELLKAFVGQMESGDEIKVNIAGWLATPKNGGNRYIQLSVSAPMEERSSAPQRQSSPFGGSRDKLDDEIPF